jgi:hypothetical protein
MPPRSAFASRSRYEILGEQDVDVESEESEVEQTLVFRRGSLSGTLES